MQIHFLFSTAGPEDSGEQEMTHQQGYQLPT